MIKNLFLHLRKIAVHRYWVRHYCFMVGLYWQGIVHDLSKYSIAELSESIKYYCGNDSPINKAKADKGYSTAWMHHRGRNKHHREYWTDNYDKGTTCVRMPYKYVAETICDWFGAGRAYYGKDFTIEKECKWVRDNIDKMKMHDETKRFCRIIVESIEKYGERAFNKELFEYVYGMIERDKNYK